MAQTTVNPYEEIGAQVLAGLAAIGGTLTGGYTIDDLVNAVYAYVESVYWPGGTTAQIEIEIKSIARTCINSYVNNNVLGGLVGYGSGQFRFIEMLIGNSLTSNMPLNSISNRIEDVEDNITDNQLTVAEQTPLLLATTIGSNADTYWNTVIASALSPWQAYIANLNGGNLNIAYWDAAAMNGALAGYNATAAGMVEPSVNFVTNKMVSALIAALTVTAGKVIFNWIPRIQHMNLMMNMGSGIPFRGGGEKFDSANSGGFNPHSGGPLYQWIYKYTGVVNGQGACGAFIYMNTQNGDEYFANGGNATMVAD